jgi:hypothetical protein
MRALFVFLRVVAAFISLSFVGLGMLTGVLAVWLVWQLPRTGAELGALFGMAAFGVLMLYLGTRVLREQGRMFLAWWGSLRRAPGLPPARLVLR